MQNAAIKDNKEPGCAAKADRTALSGIAVVSYSMRGNVKFGNFGGGKFQSLRAQRRYRGLKVVKSCS